ncbi:uncharacterized protein ACIQIH_015326 [Cyanocitta cristata]
MLEEVHCRHSLDFSSPLAFARSDRGIVINARSRTIIVEKIAALNGQKNPSYRDLPHLRGTEFGMGIQVPARSIQKSLWKQLPGPALSLFSTCSLMSLVSK